MSKLLRYGTALGIVSALALPMSAFAVGTVTAPADGQAIADTAAASLTSYGGLAAGVVVLAIGAFALYKMGWVGLSLAGKVISRFGR